MSNETVGRSDGLNNPMSINSGIGCTWSDVEDRCEESDAVAQYDRTASGITITYVDGQTETFTEPAAAFAAINQY